MLERLKRRIPRHAERRIDHPICHDLASWAATHPGGSSIVLEPARRLERPLPKTVDPDIDPVRDRNFMGLASYMAPQRNLVKIPGARIRGEHGLVILPNGEFAGELVALTADGQRGVLQDDTAYYPPIPRRSVRKDGNFYAVLGIGVNNYYHFTHDLVMKLGPIKEMLPADTTFLVPENMTPSQRGAVDVLGLPSHQLVSFPSDEIWQLENLYTVTPIRKGPNDTPEHYEWYRRAAMERHGVRDQPATRRLFLSRRHDRYRRAVNEPEVERVLARYGFETITPATMSLRDQIEHFSAAEMVVGTGAGFANLVFAPPGGKMLEFYERRLTHTTFWTMAAALRFDHYFFRCDEVANPGDQLPDLDVSIPTLEATLMRMIPG